MDIYFLTLHVEPAPENEVFDTCKAADAHFWVAEKSGDKALAKAKFHLKSHKWQFKAVEQKPIVTTTEHFADQDRGLAKHQEAQRHGIALAIQGWSRDGKSSAVVKF